MFENKSFLITGGTGSFGNTLVEKLLATSIETVLVLSRDEAKQHTMRLKYRDSRLKFVLGDVRDPEKVRECLDAANYVFHAAALKQVPAGEQFPWEFVRTNVGGSHNVLSAMSAAGVEKAVFLSTDKAVYPVNAMGISKAMMEKLVRSQTYSNKTVSLITRYGNVIGSRGSVIPAFIESIKTRNAVDITSAEMTRFMMTLSESVDLVLHALEFGNKGDLFVQKAPAATVETVVAALEILLGAKNVVRNIVGIRPGEKIHESLLTAEERSKATETGKFFQVPNIRLPEDETAQGSFENFKEYTSSGTTHFTAPELASFLETIPEIRALLS
jgi:UDP-glucose 4-epimerase